MNKNKSQLTLYNLIIIINDGVWKGRSLASSVVRPLRPFRCVGWKPRFTFTRNKYKAAEIND